MARVSIVIPHSNRKDALKITLDSIFAQRFQDFELLVADDGSTDNSGPFVLGHFGPDPGRAEQVWRDSLHEDTGTRSIQMTRAGVAIRYLFSCVPRGLAAARNRAIASATGDFLAFADTGDVWHPCKLGTQIGAIDEHPAIHAIADDLPPATTRTAPAKKRKELSTVPFEEALIPPGLGVSGILVRRTALDWEGPFDENLPACDDFDFCLRLATRFSIARVTAGLQKRTATTTPSSWSVDRYRVYSMEKAFQSGHLDALQRHRVAEALVERCAQLAHGYRQRDNNERANFYERKRKRFVTEVAKLDVSDPLFIHAARDRRLSVAPA